MKTSSPLNIFLGDDMYTPYTPHTKNTVIYNTFMWIKSCNPIALFSRFNKKSIQKESFRQKSFRKRDVSAKSRFRNQSFQEGNQT